MYDGIVRFPHGKLLALLEASLGSRSRGYRWFSFHLLLSDVQEIASILSTTEVEAKKIQNTLRTWFKQYISVLDGEDMDRLMKQPSGSIVPTGIPSIDALLGGGFKAGNTYHLFGPAASGKTEIGYLAMLAFMRFGFGRPARVAVIDSERSFRPERLVQLSGGAIELDKIFVATCYSSPHLITLLDTVSSMMRRGEFIPLLVIDSVMPASFHLYQDEPVKRQRMLLEIAERLWRISRDHGSCVVFTNHASKDFPLPSGSNVLLGYSDHAIYMRKNDFDPTTHEARSIKSPAGERDARFHIGSAGFTA